MFNIIWGPDHWNNSIWLHIAGQFTTPTMTRDSSPSRQHRMSRDQYLQANEDGSRFSHITESDSDNVHSKYIFQSHTSFIYYRSCCTWQWATKYHSYSISNSLWEELRLTPFITVQGRPFLKVIYNLLQLRVRLIQVTTTTINRNTSEGKVQVSRQRKVNILFICR